MKTECKQKELEFQGLKTRQVVGEFDGGFISSDSGCLLLREVERHRGILEQFSACFTDYRKSKQIEHSVKELLSQRVMGICLGYEDLIDHDQLRKDPLLAMVSGKEDILGAKRLRKSDQGKSLAGKSTLNRLELTPEKATSKARYKKIVYDATKIEALFVDVFLQSYSTPPEQITLDLDTTDDEIHGHQEGRFFHGYYGHYCYLPLYIFCGTHLLCAKLNTSDKGGGTDAVTEVERIVGKIREQWPDVKILLRGDSDFSKEALMSWCEANQTDYLFGLRRNPRLERELTASMEAAKKLFEQTGEASRVFKEFRYQTLQKTWSKERRVIGKAEYLEKGENPRFVVTSLEEDGVDVIYEKRYCARGDMENRIKEQQLYLFSDRTSTQTLRANQLRLWLSSVAYLLINALRSLSLSIGDWTKAQCERIRLHVLKIGAQIKISCRRIKISFSSAYPYQDLFRKLLARLRQQPTYPR